MSRGMNRCCPKCGDSFTLSEIKPRFACKLCGAELMTNLVRVSVLGLLAGSVVAAIFSGVVKSAATDVLVSIALPVAIAFAAICFFGKIESRSRVDNDQ